jgi:hypothetical protein
MAGQLPWKVPCLGTLGRKPEAGAVTVTVAVGEHRPRLA